MPAKTATSASRPPFGLPELTVAVRTSLLSCRKARKTRVFTPLREPSEESRMKLISAILAVFSVALVLAATTAAHAGSAHPLKSAGRTSRAVVGPGVAGPAAGVKHRSPCDIAPGCGSPRSLQLKRGGKIVHTKGGL
jgi:hypothetical protein